MTEKTKLCQYFISISEMDQILGNGKAILTCIEEFHSFGNANRGKLLEIFTNWSNSMDFLSNRYRLASDEKRLEQHWGLKYFKVWHLAQILSSKWV